MHDGIMVQQCHGLEIHKKLQAGLRQQAQGLLTPDCMQRPFAFTSITG